MDEQSKSAGSYLQWQTIRQISDPSIPKQVGEMCGQCVVQALLADRGIIQPTIAIAKRIGHSGETTAGELVAALEHWDPSHNWMARLETDEEDADRLFALYYQGWWAAMMKEYGRPAHWILARGCGDDGLLEVRDSADQTRCWVMWSEFEVYWNRILVRQL